MIDRFLCIITSQWYNHYAIPLFAFTARPTKHSEISLQLRHNERDGVSNHQPHNCLLERLFRHRWKKASKLRVTGLCDGNSPRTGEFPAQRASNVEMFPFDDVIICFSWHIFTMVRKKYSNWCLCIDIHLCTWWYSFPFFFSKLAFIVALQWRHNERDGVSNPQPHDCLLNCLLSRRSKKASKLRVTGLCEGNSPMTGEFPAQRASNAENVFIWWRHHEFSQHTQLMACNKSTSLVPNRKAATRWN